MICLGIKKSIKFTLTGMNGSVDIAKKASVTKNLLISI
jgi:hypothetical protein